MMIGKNGSIAGAGEARTKRRKSSGSQKYLLMLVRSLYISIGQVLTIESF